jgi:hypothetical protein
MTSSVLNSAPFKTSSRIPEVGVRWNITQFWATSSDHREGHDALQPDFQLRSPIQIGVKPRAIIQAFYPSSPYLVVFKLSPTLYGLLPCPLVAF